MEALQARGRFGMRLGLGRVRALLRQLGQPQESFRGALIAGTNGKGSVQAMVASAARAAGLRVGQMPKPHLVEYRERIVVDGRAIVEEDFAETVDEVLRAADRIPSSLGPTTEFELLTAGAFAWFARSGVDLGVVEVGLGGRLDATNAWDGGIAVITNVDYDHMDRLGSTLEAIAREKAAIIKRGDRAVTGASGAGLPVIRRRAHRLGVPLVEVAPARVLAMDRSGLTVEDPALGAVRVHLLGRHQAANLAVALACVDALEAAGLASISRDARLAGLAEARWPGRLELIELSGAARGPDGPIDLLLDGAHNESGIAALMAALEEFRPLLAPGRLTFVVGLMGDKDIAAMLGRCVRDPMLAGARVIATNVDSRRALPALDLADAWRRLAPGAEVVAIASPEAALEAALEAGRRDGGPIVVAGSLYLVGAVRGRLAARGLVEDTLGGSPHAPGDASDPATA